MTFPRHHLAVDLGGRRVVVVGGGTVAARRVDGLLAAGADVLVVAPRVVPDLAAAAGERRLAWQARAYRTADLEGAWLVHVATGDPAVDAAVLADAEQARVWAVLAGDAAASPAWTAATARIRAGAPDEPPDEVTVAVTGGGDPRRAARLRTAVQTALETGALPLRRQRRHGEDVGRVDLVGGGPGDPGLLTVRGRTLLAGADVVVVDRLAPRSLLGELDEDVLVVDVGKTPDHHPVPQEEINRLLVEHARAGRRVVRLKGGDPFVLGRGGEEAAACRAAGVPVAVVPGVTSAIAVPAAAGIPVTHRGVARQVTVTTGHDDLDWPTLARVEGTLVLLMGVTRLPQTAARLVEHGRPASTPVAVIESGSLPGQRTTAGTLATIADLARSRRVRNPAVIVVGDVVTLREHLADSP